MVDRTPGALRALNWSINYQPSPNNSPRARSRTPRPLSERGSLMHPHQRTRHRRAHPAKVPKCQRLCELARPLPRQPNQRRPNPQSQNAQSHQPSRQYPENGRASRQPSRRQNGRLREALQRPPRQSRRHRRRRAHSNGSRKPKGGAFARRVPPEGGSNLARIIWAAIVTGQPYDEPSEAR